ncbi:MAG: hypothetical protein KIT73_13625 [Burkholderiales bacterium]|nr:hypothetical protein [Burkholderiales bacterium]
MNARILSVTVCACALVFDVQSTAFAMGDKDHDLAKDMATEVYDVPYDKAQLKRDVDRKSDAQAQTPAGKPDPEPVCDPAKGQTEKDCTAHAKK